MKNLVKYFSIAALSGSLFIGCVDMDLTPKDQPAESVVWNSPIMSEQAVTGVYSPLKDFYSQSWNFWFDVMGSIMDRDANWTGFYQLFGTLTPSSASASIVWKANYSYILKANDVIANLPNSAITDEALKSRLISECRFLRSWWYYQLNALYVGVPYYDEAIKSIDDAKGSRLTQEQVWQKIVEDLTLCINDPNLPNKYNTGNANYGRITKGAAYALRGKVFLWLKEWKMAEEDLKAVETCGYKLYTTGTQPYKDLFTVTNEACDEMIFSVQCINEEGYGNAKVRGYGNRSCANGQGWNNHLINPAFVDSYENKDGSKFDWDQIIPGYIDMNNDARRVYFLRNGLTDTEKKSAIAAGADMDKYDATGNEARIRKAYENRDPRLEFSVITPYAAFLGGSKGTASTFYCRFPFRDEKEGGDLRTDTQSMLYYLNRKFVGEGMEFLNYYSELDAPLIRYADVLLNLAEALNEQGGDKMTEAINIVNQVRDRAGVALLNSNTATTVAGQMDLRQRIRNERYWELVGEDVIYFDELRWGTWKEKKFYTDKSGEINGLRQVWGSATYHYSWGGDKYWAYPIPEGEMQKNPNMVQTPGWE